MEFISDTNLIIIPVIYCIGYVLKVAECIDDNYIPLYLIALGAVLGLFNGLDINNALQGILCAAVSMGLYDTTKTVGRSAKKWTKK